MLFKVGDHVVHASHGLGQIVAIEEKRLSGDEARRFYEVVTTKSTVWVPVDTGSASNLRLLTPKTDLARCRALLKSRPTPLNADRRQRYVELTDRLRQGSFEVMCEVVRDLAGHGWPKPLSEADASTLRKVQESVCREWAAAAGLPVSEAGQEIAALLQEGRRAHGS